MQFRVDSALLNNYSSSLSNLACETANVSQSLENILTQITAPGPEAPMYMTGSAISSVLSDLKTVQGSITSMGNSLISIGNEYANADRGASGAFTGNISTGTKAVVPQTVSGSSQSSGNDSIADRYSSSFGDQFWGDLRDTVIEQAGNTIVKIGGFINYSRGLVFGPNGKNSFVILDPSVTQVTSKWINAGAKIATGAKYGLPVLGGIIDFISLKNSGTSTANAFLKSSAHVAISLGGGAIGESIGAAVGGIVGSVIPGPGTAVGAVVGGVVGFISGTVISTLGNAVFDFVYDNHVAEAVDNIANSVFDGASRVANDIGNGIANAAENIGKGIQNTFEGIGNAFHGALSGLGCIFG